MISKNDVVVMKINEWVSKDELEHCWEIASKMGKSLYNRQSENDTNRINKAYVGILAETLVKKYMVEKGVVATYDGLEGDHNRNSDDYDFLIKGKTVDIKSSKEKNNAPFFDRYGKAYDDYVDFALNNRNFTLPADQATICSADRLKSFYCVNAENAYVKVSKLRFI